MKSIFCRQSLICLLTLVLLPVCPAFCQDPGGAAPPGGSGSKVSKLFDSVFDYLNVANQGKLRAFQPLTQKERNHSFAKSLVNPIWYLKGAASAGINQWTDTPEEWEQGASGYGKRFGDIMGQYAVRKTTMFGFESLLHEDNRYFGSGKKGFWPRTGYALSSGILARHDSGKRYPSASLLIGFAGGACISRFWQPSGERSLGDAASSFGISMGWNIGLGVVKEFLPDMLRPLMRGNRAPEDETRARAERPASCVGGPVARRSGSRIRPPVAVGSLFRLLSSREILHGFPDDSADFLIQVAYRLVGVLVLLGRFPLPHGLSGRRVRRDDADL